MDTPSPQGPARLFDAGTHTRAELIELGSGLRKACPRSSHAEWKPPPDRPDPVAILKSQEAERVESLIPIRYGRMRVSPLTFYRGAAAVMAWDLARTPTTGICVQACGDAHLLNFGVYASPERRVVFDVNDFDETLPAPWELDIKRLAASVLLDARGNGFPDATGLDWVREAVRAYCDAMATLATMRSVAIHYAHAETSRMIDEATDERVAEAMRETVARAEERTHLQAAEKFVETANGQSRFIEDPPLLQRLPDQEVEQFHTLWNRYRETLQVDRRLALQEYRFRDVARKVVGVGSVGLRAYVILLEGRGDPDPLLIQVKQAVSSVLTPYVGRSGYPRHGQRVVVGQRIMQATSDPFLGWAPFAEHDVYVRQLRDMKGKDALPRHEVVWEANNRLYGSTLARAHARSVDPGLVHGYLGGGAPFVEALASFARAYADQIERDHERLEQAISGGEIPAEDH